MSLSLALLISQAAVPRIQPADSLEQPWRAALTDSVELLHARLLSEQATRTAVRSLEHTGFADDESDDDVEDGWQQALDGAIADIDAFHAALAAHIQLGDAVSQGILHAQFNSFPSGLASTVNAHKAMGWPLGASFPVWSGTSDLTATADWPSTTGTSWISNPSDPAAFGFPATNLQLLPMSFGPFDPAHPDPVLAQLHAFLNGANWSVFYYSFDSAFVGPQSGIALERSSNGTSVLQLRPDTITGSTAFAPADIALMRYAMAELGVQPGDLYQALMPSLVVPDMVVTNGGGSSFVDLGPGLLEWFLCIAIELSEYSLALQAAIQEYDQKHSGALDSALFSLADRYGEEVFELNAEGLGVGDIVEEGIEEGWISDEEVGFAETIADKYDDEIEAAKEAAKTKQATAKEALEAGVEPCFEGFPNPQEALEQFMDSLNEPPLF